MGQLSPAAKSTYAMAGLGVAAFTLVFWGVGRVDQHYYYASAVRSMSGSWHAFLYGALDPAASITLDKMPGAFWLQALSARLFGSSDAAIALPQALLVAATALVLADAVRRWAGTAAGVGAGIVFVLTPITVVLGRFNIPDTALIFCQVCAAHATLRATGSGRWRTLLAAGVWVGLAFQVKMIQAFAVLPSMALVYLVAAPGSFWVRLGKGIVACCVAVAISAIWPVLVALTPAHARPYVDASTGNSVWEMIFGYNGLGRIIHMGGVQRGTFRLADDAGWTRLFGTALGPQMSWLIPFALVALALGIASRRGRPRTDGLRAGWLLWGSWLLVHGAEFSTASDINPYYTAALAPAIGALASAGFVMLIARWREGTRWNAGARWSAGVARWVLPLSVAATGAWAVILCLRDADYLPWVWPTTLGLTVVGCGLLLRRHRAAVGVTAAALLFAPASWAVAASGSTMKGLSAMNPKAGPVHHPSAKFLAAIHGFPAHHVPAGDLHMYSPNLSLLAYVKAHDGGERYLLAVPTAQTAAPYLRAGYSVLPMGGFTGSVPLPTIPQLSELIARGELRYALTGGFHAAVGGAISRERQDWIKAHCEPVPAKDYENPTEPTGPEGHPELLFDCRHAGSARQASGGN